MEETIENEATVKLPKEAQTEAKEIINNAFRLFKNHAKQLADEVAEFNQRRRETRERIANGANRTSGRIV